MNLIPAWFNPDYKTMHKVNFNVKMNPKNSGKFTTFKFV